MYNEKKIPWYWILLCAGLLSGACIANLVQAQGGIGVSLWGDEIQEKLLLVKGVPVSYLKYLAPRRLGGCVLLLLAGQTIFGKIVNGMSAVFMGMCAGFCLGLLAVGKGILAPACFLCMSFPQYLLYLPAGFLLWDTAGRLAPERGRMAWGERYWKIAGAVLLTVGGIASETWLNPVIMGIAGKYF